MKPIVSVIMGSTSDMPVMKQAAEFLDSMEIPFEINALSATPVPVIGVPIKSSNSMDGWDSVLSILQMPSGIPVATVALDGAKNAAILAAQIIGTGDPAVMEKVVAFKTDLASKIEKANRELKEIKYKFKVD